MAKHYRRFGMAVRIVETGEVFESMTECAEYLGVGISSVSQHLSGKTHTCGGYHLEMIEMRFKHPLTDEIIEELYEMTGENCEWREHPWRDNVYVSDSGLIAKYQNRQVVLKRQHIINSGYHVVSVGDKGTITSKNHNVLVHVLVAETFVPNDDPVNKRYVNHDDTNKHNNHAYNLVWCTHPENMRHAVDNGLYPTLKVRIVETGEIFNSASACARAIGGTPSGMHDVRSGRQSKHRGYTFEYLDSEDDMVDYDY